MNEEALYEHIARVLSGEATAEEAAALRRQCSTDKNAENALQAAEQLWQSGKLHFPNYNTESAWQKVSGRLGFKRAALPPVRRSLSFPTWARWAAAAAVVGISVTIGLQWNNSDSARNATPQMAWVATAPTQVITLADGSTVTLKKGSKLTVSNGFEKGATREVTLQGVAFFKVTKDATRPFVVQGENLTVKVLGTSFEINENANQVQVATGRVEVAAAGEKVVLLAGEEAVLANAHLQKETADPNSLYWKTGTLSFSQKSFSEVIEEISRILEVPVQFGASVSTADRMQSVTFSSQSSTIEPILTDLCQITGSRWTKDGNAYRILRAR